MPLNFVMSRHFFHVAWRKRTKVYFNSVYFASAQRFITPNARLPDCQIASCRIGRVGAFLGAFEAGHRVRSHAQKISPKAYGGEFVAVPSTKHVWRKAIEVGGSELVVIAVQTQP